MDYNKIHGAYFKGAPERKVAKIDLIFDRVGNAQKWFLSVGMEWMHSYYLYEESIDTKKSQIGSLNEPQLRFSHLPRWGEKCTSFDLIDQSWVGVQLRGLCSLARISV